MSKKVFKYKDIEAALLIFGNGTMMLDGAVEDGDTNQDIQQVVTHVVKIDSISVTSSLVRVKIRGHGYYFHRSDFENGGNKDFAEKVLDHYYFSMDQFVSSDDAPSE